LQIAEGKDAREFVNLLPLMANVAIKALQQDDETVLEDALVEFNEIAEIEPKFFRKNFKDLFTAFHPIVAKNDYTNNTIRHQPIEFSVTVVERIPNIVKKD
jgi:dimeric dUTPase (all-alpha-NTP-PPase superfamily)